MTHPVMSQVYCWEVAMVSSSEDTDHTQHDTPFMPSEREMGRAVVPLCMDMPMNMVCRSLVWVTQ